PENRFPRRNNISFCLLPPSLTLHLLGCTRGKGRNSPYTVNKEIVEVRVDVCHNLSLLLTPLVRFEIAVMLSAVFLLTAWL
ncbi:hypothetical protein L9F63_027827, partial [Diploptera punctata]